MKNPIVRILAAFLAVGALALWIRVNLNGWTYSNAQTASAGTALEQAATSTLASVPVPASGYVDQSGMILMDSSQGSPSIPFLQYTTPDNKVMTKQLVLPYNRPCSVYAGDLPCVAIDPAQAYPQLQTGQNVRIRGIVKDDRILVYQIN